METTIYVVFGMAIIAGIFNGFAWLIPGIYSRVPNFLFVGVGFLMAGMVSAVYMLIVGGIPAEIKPLFAHALITDVTLLTIAFCLSAAAPRISDYSLIRPIHAFTPVLMLVSGVVLTSFGLTLTWAPVSLWGAVGIVIMCLGLYALFTSGDRGLRTFFKTIQENRGVQMIIVVVIIFSVTSYVNLIGVQNSSPSFYLMCLYTLIGVLCLILFLLERMFLPSVTTDYRLASVSAREWRAMVLFGVLFPIASIFHVEAMNIAGHVTYVVAIKEGITAIDAALTLWLIAKYMPWMLSDTQHREVSILSQRIWPMSIIATGIVVLIVFGD